MDMIRTSSGKLRAMGYDAHARTLRIELEDGTALEYVNVGESLWRNLKSAGSPWSYYRDHLEEELTARRSRVMPASTTKQNLLDDLFG